MSEETEAAVRVLREAAPQITEHAVRYIYAGAVTEAVVGALFAAIGAVLIRAAVKEQKKEYGNEAVMFGGWVAGGLAICIALICIGDATPALISPEGRALYALIPQG